MRHVLALIAALAGAISLPIDARPPQPSSSLQVDAVVRQQIKEQHIPGVGLAVVRHGKLILARGYGLANVELAAPVSPETVFEAGSITMQFVATAIMLLAQDGKLKLNDDISRYFPEASPVTKTVTIRNLLTHTSGIPDVSDGTSETSGAVGVVDFHREYSESQLASAYLRQPLQFKPGTKWSYCNACYDLLGFLIHRVSGQFYGDFLRQRIFAPTGMTTARVFSQADIIPNRVGLYSFAGGQWKNAPDWWSQSIRQGAAGGLWMSVLDLAKWDAALDSNRILTRTSLETMWAPVPLDDGSAYPGGMGWFIAKANGHRVVFHTNGGPGSSAVVSRYLDDGLTIIVMTNLGAHHTDVMKINGRIAELYLPDTKGGNPIKDW